MDLKDFEVELESIETCISLEYVRNIETRSYLKVNLPKLMPNMHTNGVSVETLPINSNILVNNANTKPKVDNSLLKTNYINAKRVQIPMYDKEVFIGTKLMAIIKNKNLKDIYFIPL